MAGEGPYRFPDFDVNVLHSTVVDDLQGVLALEVVSQDDPEDSTAREDARPAPAVKFAFTIISMFRSADYEGATANLRSFMEVDTPSLIAWPYVRSFISDMLTRSGLPEYHLPLLQIRTRLEAPTPVEDGAELE